MCSEKRDKFTRKYVPGGMFLRKFVPGESFSGNIFPVTLQKVDVVFGASNFLYSLEDFRDRA